MEQNKDKVAENSDSEIKQEQEPFAEHLAMEMLKNEHRKHKAKDLAIICLSAVVIIVALGMAIINYCNDRDWRILFSDYDFISQDGEGINNANYGEQGDLINDGSEGEIEEGQEER